MESEELQRRIHNGDRAAFGILFDAYSRTVYSRALSSLDYSSEQAKEVVKAVFITVYQDIRAADAPFDVAARITRLTDMESAAVLRRAAAQPVNDRAQQNVERAQQNVERAQPQDEHAQPQAGDVRPAQTQPAYAPNPPQTAQSDRPLAQTEAPVPAPEQPAAPAADATIPAEPDPAAQPAPKARRGKGARLRDVIVTVLICVLFACFLWVLAGILMDSGVLPVLDLGYSWFNGAVYPLFKLGA